jgi:XTP/dITP diphosphohydrolase
MKIIIASNNIGKIKEIEDHLKTLSITLVPQSAYNISSIEETGASFVENALLKARHAAKYSGMPALADDSGLSVDVLNGAPGIYSARYAGPSATDADNIAKLLKATENFPEGKRQASFYCALVFVRDALDPVPLICVGQWKGKLLTHPQGTQGFGYDPIFYVSETHCSAAELPAYQKNELSHRGKAMKILIAGLRTIEHDSV